MFRLMLVGDESAGRLAQRLIASVVRVSVGVEAAQTALGHSVEGLVTPLVREEAPKDTDALAAGLRAHVVRHGAELVVTWESDQPYSDFVLHGTGRFHIPDPHSAWDVEGMQVFTVGGETVFAMHTHHEGQHSDDFIGRAQERAELPIRAAMTMVGDRLLVSFLSGFEGI